MTHIKVVMQIVLLGLGNCEQSMHIVGINLFFLVGVKAKLYGQSSHMTPTLCSTHFFGLLFIP